MSHSHPAARRPAPLKAILFDLDDTLWPITPVLHAAEHSLHAWLATHAPRVARQFSIDTLRQRRLALLAEQPHYALDLAALRRSVLLAAFEAAGEDAAKVEAAMLHFLAARNAVTPYPDVLPGLASLKRRVRLGTISNGNADLEVIGLAHHFEVSLAACKFGRAKPDPAIFHAACAAMGVEPGEAAYVGDDLLLDVAGAQAAGMRALWLRRDDAAGAEPDGQVRPDAICASFDEIVVWLDQQAQE